MEEQRAKRIPKCGYCQNHGIKNPLRAHKRDCKFLDCPCRLCVNTRLRREHMADMQYIKRNGVVELERIQNETDAQAKKKDIYVKIFHERMANKNKKRMMKDLKSGNSSQETALLLGDTGSSNSVNAVSPTSSITDPLPSQLATLANLRAFAGSNPIVNLASAGLESSNLDPQSLTNLHNQTAASNRPYTGIFPNTSSSAADSMMTNDQFLKAAKILGIGLNSATTSSNSANPLIERSSFRNEDVDLNELSEFINRLSIVNSLNNDEKVLNAAICILFNGLPLALLNPGNVAEEIYSTFKQLNTTNIFR